MNSGDIKEMTIQNTDFRRVIFTVPDNFQLVLMSLKPLEIIPFETHKKATQFIRVEKGKATVEMESPPGSKNYKTVELGDGGFVVIPPNTRHEVRNTDTKNRLQLYTIYTPPQHKPGTVEKNQIPEIESKEKGIFSKILYKNDPNKFGLFISPEGKATIAEKETGIIHCLKYFGSKENALEKIKCCKMDRPDVCPVCSKKQCE